MPRLIQRLKPCLPVLSVFVIVLACARPGAAQEAPAQNVTIDPSLTSLSLPHVHACQRGFMRLFGVPAGADPDETLMVRGARQTVVEDTRLGPEFRSMLEMQMPYERMLPGGAVLTGVLTCLYGGTGLDFDARPERVTILEEGETRILAGPQLDLFR